MTRISELEDENTFKNNLGRENRSAIKRSIIMVLMAIGAIAAALLLAPPANPTQTGAAATARSASTEDPAASSEPTDLVGSDLPRYILLPGERIELSFY